VCVLVLWLALLKIFTRTDGPLLRRSMKIALGLSAVAISFVPIDGLALWRWAFGIWPNPSLPLLGIVGISLARRLFGWNGLSATDRRALWIFGAVAGTILYLHSAFLGGVDLYYWGWDRVVSVSVLAAIAIAFVAMGNRSGILILTALVASQFGVLESANHWDYVIDPIYWLISVGVCVRALAIWGWTRRRKLPTTDELPVPAEEGALAAVGGSAELSRERAPSA
jgi:hypothetical protein